jgi:hypothetical protein
LRGAAGRDFAYDIFLRVMTAARYNPLRSIGAYSCLVAVLLIYAPQGMIAWWAGTGACCKSDYCPIHEHHGSKAAAAGEHDGMNCQHDAGEKAGMAACTMNCCDDPEKVLVAPVIFLPNAADEPAPMFAVACVAQMRFEMQKKLGSKPLSPPPRFFVAA